MRDKYKIINFLEKKETRFTALIEYKSKKAILKKLTTDSKVLKNKFLNEINVLINIEKDFIPKVYEYGEDYIIIEYFESYDNKPENFSKIITNEFIKKIKKNLLDINSSKIKSILSTRSNLLLNISKVILKLWMKSSYKTYHFKAFYLLFYLRIKHFNIFNSQINTKGDFTEVNILLNNNEIRFIDFDAFNTKGFWIEDASYLFLHQDVEIEKLSWQKLFLKSYISDVNNKYIKLNYEYIRFWLIYTSINQFYIRHHQYKNGQANIEEVNAKEEHLKYFLDKKRTNKFLKEIGINI